ncbi:MULTISPECIES: ATP-binding protein [Streptomyces]|uniref:Putative regulatory protein n=1 Tax=Streptomyces himastatinicus ATCC 53653 TaxID=457427 RepID=D9WJT5_9ACTN|nr:MULTISPECIES: ATP-binding protein [Streptomyces]EFL23498.1 putative regulatory protein [Streptomyces himastatinicus ATCC 53653]
MIGVSESAGTAAGPTPGFVEWVFPAEPGSVRAARWLVRQALDDWGLSALGDVTALLVSELVTNALRYASGPIGLRMYARRETGVPRSVLMVEVSDPLDDPPHARTASPEDESGRGLELIARAALRWGTRHGRAGKTVWFELPLPG